LTHRRLNVLTEDYHPAYVVWELTLRCDHACTHCGSRAGIARDDELSTAEALDVVNGLAKMRTREVVLIGGEAYLHTGFLDIARALVANNIVASMTTGGRGITAALAQEMAQAGISGVNVSIDGLQETHDRMRNSPGSFAAGTAAIDNLRAAGISVGSNINVNRSNRDDLEPLYDLLRQRGIESWQVQLTAPLGRAADRANMVLQPWDLLDLLPRIAALKQRAYDDDILIMPGNNLGYFGPEEAVLRSLHRGDKDHWAGCQAGKFVMGIESDGAVKGCPSLQTAHYVGGNVREKPLQSLWKDSAAIGFTRNRGIDSLWGFCATCDFAEVCLGGCSFTAHSILGRPGNNPYCHYRARTLAKQGKRERLVPTTAADGRPFDNGLFDVVLEALDADDPATNVASEQLLQITRRPKRMKPRLEADSA